MSLLCDALQNQDSFESIRDLLKGNNSFIDYQEHTWGQTPLFLALAMSREDVALEIIRRGANVEISRFDNTTPFAEACSQNLQVAVGEIIMRLPDLEDASHHGRTPIHFAAQFSCLENVKLLVSRGASLQFKDQYARSVFHAAVHGGNLDTAKYLLAEFVELFSVHDCDTRGYQALHFAAWGGHALIAKWLIAQGAMVDEHINSSFTPLKIASQDGHIDVVRCLLESGAEVNPGICRRPLFCSTLRGGRVSFIRDLNQARKHFDPFLTGTPPLACAVLKGHVQIVRELLLVGADPHRVYYFGITSRDQARLPDHRRAIELLDAWKSIQALWVACSAGQIPSIGRRSVLKRLPKDLFRMIGSMFASKV
jgi:ankyrin repeat protein